jgi:hypothetical protein
VRSKPIIIAQAILTGLGILFGAALLGDLIDPRWVGLGALIVIATKGGIDFYVNATTTPNAQVVATQTSAGEPVVAGQASLVTTGAELRPTDTVNAIAPVSDPVG